MGSTTKSVRRSSRPFCTATRRGRVSVKRLRSGWSQEPAGCLGHLRSVDTALPFELSLPPQHRCDASASAFTSGTYRHAKCRTVHLFRASVISGHLGATRDALALRRAANAAPHSCTAVQHVTPLLPVPSRIQRRASQWTPTHGASSAKRHLSVASQCPSTSGGSSSRSLIGGMQVPSTWPWTRHRGIRRWPRWRPCAHRSVNSTTSPGGWPGRHISSAPRGKTSLRACG